MNVRVNDLTHSIRVNGIVPRYYQAWADMFRRCKDRDSSVCEDWHKLSSFKKWYDKHHVVGWQLDKDILIDGNTQYSPSTSVFVPQEINKLYTDKKLNKKSKLPTGVYTYKNGKYKSSMSQYGRQKYIGIFDSIELAQNAYEKERTSYVLSLCEKYKNILPEFVIESMMNKYS